MNLTSYSSHYSLPSHFKVYTPKSCREECIKCEKCNGNEKCSTFALKKNNPNQCYLYRFGCERDDKTKQKLTMYSVECEESTVPTVPTIATEGTSHINTFFIMSR